MSLIRTILNWTSLADYDAAKEQATVDVVARFSRGNVSVQNGQVLDEADLRKVSTEGDQALAKLDRLRTKA